MRITAALTTLEQIVGLREQYRQEMNCKSFMTRSTARPGWSLEYALSLEDRLLAMARLRKPGHGKPLR